MEAVFDCDLQVEAAISSKSRLIFIMIFRWRSIHIYCDHVQLMMDCRILYGGHPGVVENRKRRLLWRMANCSIL